MATQRASAKLGFGSFFPWRLSAPFQVFLWTGVVLLVTGLAINLFRTTTTIQAPSFAPLQELTEVQRAAQVVPQQPVVEPIVRSENPPAETHSVSAQNEPEAEPGAGAIVPTTWPLVQVEWLDPFPINSLTDLPPSLPAGKGFYRETPEGVGNAGSSEEAYAFAQKIFGVLTPPNTTPVLAGVARDFSNPNIVFAGISVTKDLSRGFPLRDPIQDYLFLSVDGEKTWVEIYLIHPDDPMGGTLDVRVAHNGNIVILFARDREFVAPMWRKAVVSLEDLP